MKNEWNWMLVNNSSKEQHCVNPKEPTCPNCKCDEEE